MPPAAMPPNNAHAVGGILSRVYTAFSHQACLPCIDHARHNDLPHLHPWIEKMCASAHTLFEKLSANRLDTRHLYTNTVIMHPLRPGRHITIDS